LAALPTPARAGRIRLRADAGYFAGQLARAALFADIEFAIGARRIAPLWLLLDGLTEADWTDAIDMARRSPWPTLPQLVSATTRLLIRRVRLDVAAEPVSADPRARRRRTLHPDQRALPLPELATLDTVYGYSSNVTNLEVTTPDRAAAVEHWYRHRTQVENIFRDAKAWRRAAPPALGISPGEPGVDVGALLAAGLTGWLHQLTVTPAPGGKLLGHGVRDGQAMIATLRHRLICVPPGS
jgi:hypothetical protein